MPDGSKSKPSTDHTESAQSRRSLRFAQARSIGILLVLLALLALVLYNTLAEGTPWVTRGRDVRLLMTLLSILLGLDVVIGNHRAAARLVGRALIQYANDSPNLHHRDYEHPDDDAPPHDRASATRDQSTTDPPPGDTNATLTDDHSDGPDH